MGEWEKKKEVEVMGTQLVATKSDAFPFPLLFHKTSSHPKRPQLPTAKLCSFVPSFMSPHKKIPKDISFHPLFFYVYMHISLSFFTGSFLYFPTIIVVRPNA